MELSHDHPYICAVSKTMIFHLPSWFPSFMHIFHPKANNMKAMLLRYVGVLNSLDNFTLKII